MEWDCFSCKRLSSVFLFYFATKETELLQLSGTERKICSLQVVSDLDLSPFPRILNSLSFSTVNISVGKKFRFISAVKCHSKLVFNNMNEDLLISNSCLDFSLTTNSIKSL